MDDRLQPAGAASSATPGSTPAVLVTGATGYIGGRLVAVLENADVRLRCLARHPAALASRVASTTEVVAGDLFDSASLDSALAGIDVAYYLVHSMGAHGDYREKDRAAARNFGDAARRAGVRRIVYMGGLATSDEALSTHLESRLETGRILRESGVPVVEFRASVVIGSGSLSFELIRALVERLPVMICPRWVATLAQPIGIDDVLAYLVAALDLPDGESRIFEIGGADRASYGDVMRQYARQRGLKRLMIAVPFLTPRLSSLWLGLVTPVYARVGRALIAGLKNKSVVTDPAALSVFPIRPVGLREAIGRAIRYEDRAFALTRWSDARSSGGEWKLPADARFGSRLVDARRLHVAVAAPRAFAPIAGIGGARGWYYATWLWRIRGALDLIMGGVGMRRGRRDPDTLAVGDALDFWRVEAFEPGRRLRLAAEMKLPGRAWLEFEVVPDAGGAVVHQTAVFDPVGLAGLLYWYALVPVHALVFGGLLRGIAQRALQVDRRASSTERNGMDVNLETLKADLESVVEGISVEQLRRSRPGKWSAAEVLEHLFLTYTGTIKGLERALAEGRPLATRASFRQRIATFIVVSYGHMPSGRKTPSVARPRGLDAEEVRTGIGGAIETMDALLARCEERFGRRVKLLDHPILGPLSASQWRRFHCVHGRHHHKRLVGLRGQTRA